MTSKLNIMIEKMKGKCLPLRDLTAEQIEKVKEVLKDKDCILYENIKLNSDFVICLKLYTDKIGVFYKDNETPITFEGFLEIFKPFNPKRGDIILVSDDEENWMPRIFLAEIKGTRHPIITVYVRDENKFTNNEIFQTSRFLFMKPYVLPKLTKQEICEKFGIDDFELI